MVIDHIFIFTTDNGTIANDLVDFGLIEGSSRVHKGQGTANRKFYFSNFFLEILWIHDENEIKSTQTMPTGLWNRANFESKHCSPFGLCLVNSDDTNVLFKQSFSYQPEYFPQGMAIDIIKNDSNPNLPWTFRLPFKGQKKNVDEPNNHGNGISSLTKTLFEYKKGTETQFLEHFNNEERLEFMASSRNWLTLSFDNRRQGKSKDFQPLKLTIEY
ncbi:MAG: VOC family protein [bacterium]|nr:VOC family protein [bacterium]